MPAEPTERWAMVTGASSGIGRATATRLGKLGWNVAIHHRQSATLAEEVAGLVEQFGRKAKVFQADLGDADAVHTLVERAWSDVGPLGAWVHCAGVDLLTTPEARWPAEKKLELALRVDLMGTFLACRDVGDRMRRQGNGVIVTIGWDQVATGMDGDSGQIFAAVKGGVTAFSRSLAKSLAPEVRVLCVAPGWIKTAWGDGASSAWQRRAAEEALLKRWGLPEDVANTIGFVLSDDASFLTGQTINVNGGVVTT
ncbi:3-oxoacyl-[acyl-carrier-protein] reductase FabG [Planctomycetes bacterium Pan216]|uniref:3-oxoacyl-[acyl-carrier-protein] reductase FabG n=1 Tax=Kolteria novifilia TaxID=2527975 RepID=A0A518AZT0_9BACT|nr:3-oxoacyl-[acyl-carrier-protein] reductase FabG [Planctomycetes bacterium Pan216]